MMKHEEMITLIGNMFINAYVAGDRKDLDSFRSARADRDHLFDEIKDLYAELENESYEREQFQVELKEEQEHRQSLYETIRKMEAEIQRLNRDNDSLSESRGQLRIALREKADMIRSLNEQLYCQSNNEKCVELFDDAGKFSEQDLPFPDVEEMAPAEELEGSEE